MISRSHLNVEQMLGLIYSLLKSKEDPQYRRRLIRLVIDSPSSNSVLQDQGLPKMQIDIKDFPKTKQQTKSLLRKATPGLNLLWTMSRKNTNSKDLQRKQSMSLVSRSQLTLNQIRSRSHLLPSSGARLMRLPTLPYLNQEVTQRPSWLRLKVTQRKKKPSLQLCFDSLIKWRLTRLLRNKSLRRGEIKIKHSIGKSIKEKSRDQKKINSFRPFSKCKR